MRFLTALICVIVCGVVLGSAMTWISVQETRGFGALKVGEWTAWPDAGSADADPYTDARIAVDGRVPLGAAEGVLFIAKKDADGQPLQRACDYRINGKLPAARYWTLTAQNSDGADIADPFGRVEPVISEHSIWQDGTVDILIGATRRGGAEWLPLSGTGPMQLSLRLYDTQVTGTGAVGQVRIPQVERIRCAA